MLFWCDLKFEKGEKKVCQKADSNLGQLCQKDYALYNIGFTICSTGADDY